jgi:hypothetical protein
VSADEATSGAQVMGREFGDRTIGGVHF